MSRHPKPGKKYRWQMDLEAHQQECTKQRIAYLTNYLMPGQKILTCSICDIMCIVGDHQSMITHLAAPGCKRHPGAIMES